MIRRFLLFPASSYLANRWWHRLATVAFWTWLAVIAIWVWNTLILQPFSGCIRVKHSTPDDPIDLDCGSNAIDYAWTNVLAESASSIVITGAFVVAALYIAAILPSLVYRIILYIAKGGGWRDAPMPPN